MTNPGDSNAEKTTPSPPSPPPQPAPVDLESGGAAAADGGGGGGGVASIVRRCKREDHQKKVLLAMRALGFIFSLLALITMATNIHGDWKDFYHYEEYRYVFGIAILSTLYTGLHVFREYKRLSSGKRVFSSKHMAMVDFFCDQIVAYLLISAASSAVPLTNRMREGADNTFTDASAAAISMTFFAFFSMAVSALISGYKLSNQSYI